MRILFMMTLLMGILSPPVAYSQANDKMHVEGALLTYDTINVTDEINSEIEVDDIEAILALLRKNEQVTTLKLNSGGGSVWAGDEIARIVLDFGLNTEVLDECSSTCVNIFLGGAKRSMSRGGKIGFHLRDWSADSIKQYYENNREDKAWETPFDMVSWNYQDTQSEMYGLLAYLLERGVTADFAIRSIKPRGKMWFPSRHELQEAGVLRE